jgi:hypothetical protein
MDTLHHARIHDAEVVISTIPDHILKGTDNERLLKKIRQLSPSPRAAIDLYNRGADFVFIPRMHSSSEIAKVIENGLKDGFEKLRDAQLAHLRTRDEILA